jgi:hypothetical protein
MLNWGNHRQRLKRRSILNDPAAVGRLQSVTAWARANHYKPDSVYRLIATYKIRAYRFGGRWWVDPLSYQWENRSNDPIPNR